jgi:RHS repeat-associated protein
MGFKGILGFHLGLSLAAVSSTVWGVPQIDGAMPPPPVREIIDSHGINMATGQPGHGGMNVRIGNEESGIKRDPGRNRYLKDNHTGTITQITIAEVNFYDPLELNGMSAGTYLKVDAHGNSEIFKQSGTSYVDFRQTGGELSCGISVCTYISKFGVVIKFDKAVSDGYNACYDSYNRGQSCATVSETKYENIAMQTEVTLPDNEKLSYTYRPIPGGSSLSNAYISAVQSSSGWMLKYYYSPKNMWQEGGKYYSEVDRSVTAISSSVEYCNPSAEACNSLSNSWPKTEMYAKQTLNYPSNQSSDWISTTKSEVTNANGDTDSYSKTHDNIGYWHGEGYTSFGGVSYNYYKPQCAYYNGQCSSTAETGKVKQISIGGKPYTFTYSFTSNAGPDGTYSIDMSRFRPNYYVDNLGRKYRYTYHDEWKTRVHKVINPDATPSVDDPTGGYTEYLYDGRGNTTHVKRYPKGGGDPLVTTAEYPPSSSCDINRKICNKPIAITGEDGVRREFTYHAQSGMVAMVRWPAVDGNRAEVRYKYEQLTPKVRNSGSSLVDSTSIWKLTEVSTCMVGSLASCVGGSSEFRTTYRYDHNNLLMTSKTVMTGDASISLTTTMEYDIYGNLTWQDGPRPGAYDRSYYYYDAMGQRIGEIGPDPDGTGPLARRGVKTFYDADGRTKEVRTGVVSSISLSSLDAMYADEKIVKEYESGTGLHLKDNLYAGGTLKRIIQKSYDANMRLECSAIRLNSSAFNSLPTSACTLGPEGPDGNDRITKYVYDDTNAVVEVIQAYGTSNERITKRNNYRVENGLLDSVEDALGNTTFYEYDDFNRLEYTYYPSPTNGASPSSTDYVQNIYTGAYMTSVRLRDGDVVQMGYDAKGRLASRTGAIVEAITYNNFDQVVQLTSYETGGAKSDVAYDYNALGRKLAEKVYYNSALVSTVGYDYDDYGRRDQLTWSDGFFVTYNYDVSGYPSDYVQSINENGSINLASYAYDNHGRVKTLTRGNGAITSYSYDEESRLEVLSTDLSGTANDITEAFSYTVAGQLKSKQINVGNSSYMYSPAAAEVTAYGVNGLNQITSVNSSSVTYDTQGNLETRSGNTYSYLDNNLLTKVVKSGVTTSMVYDAGKRLFSISKSGNTLRLLHDGKRVIAETDSSGNIQNRYVHGLGIDDPLVWYVGSGTSTKRYYTKDRQGSIVGGSDLSGNSVFINAYDEYGVNAAANQGRFRYTGQMWLHEIGLYYYKARMYDPEIGRFLQTDPIGYEDGMNWYAYVENDPLNNLDPTGEFIVQILVVAGLAAGGVWMAVDTTEQAGTLIREGREDVIDAAVSGESLVEGLEKIEAGTKLLGAAKSFADMGTSVGNGSIPGSTAKAGVSAAGKVAKAAVGSENSGSANAESNPPDTGNPKPSPISQTRDICKEGINANNCSYSKEHTRKK